MVPMTRVPKAAADPAAIIAGSAGSISDEAASLPASRTTTGRTHPGRIPVPAWAPDGGALSSGVTAPVRWLVACMASPGRRPGGVAEKKRGRLPFRLFLNGDETNVTRSEVWAGTLAVSVAQRKVREVPSGA